jgi:hypothetical protein
VFKVKLSLALQELWETHGQNPRSTCHLFLLVVAKETILQDHSNSNTNNSKWVVLISL